MKENNNQLIQLIQRTCGIDLSKFEDTFLKKTVSKRMEETFCKTEGTYYTFLEQNQVESDLFLKSLQISYTEFFRNSLTFSILEKIIIPSIVQRKTSLNRNEIRIWTAACAGGQETYSLAMLLKEFSNGHGEEINFRIFATDQSETQIQDAQLGQYSESALSCLTMKRVNQWFTKHGDKYCIKPEIKDKIDFSVFDLFDDNYSSPPTSIFGDFDIIICANLLFYYNPEYQKKIIKKATNCLSRNGYLISGETERDILIHSGLHEVYPQTAIFQARYLQTLESE